MNITDKIEETKKRTQLMNGVTIDWQYAQQIIVEFFPIINKSIQNENSQAAYHNLFNLCTNIEKSMKGIKDMIPFDNQDGLKDMTPLDS